MIDYEVWEIAGHDLEYFDLTHTYLVDGVIVPSVTQMLKIRFFNKYANVDRHTLKRASIKGTETHRAIEEWCKNGTESDLKELRNFKFLKKQYDFDVLDNEVPVILFKDDKPICAGRLDMVIEMDGKKGLADIKRTSVLDKDYLGYQLNLYRIAYEQCYTENIEILKGLHLREDTRKFVNLPINEGLAWELIDEFERSENE